MIVFNRRQRTHVEAVIAHVDEAARNPDLLIQSELLRDAVCALSEVKGAEATEAMLDALFTRFCLGK